ncbi:DHCW motif cupin fold protein [Antarcticimicrobium sediminis]|uniref:Cupin domain-containing protein n=1 Tax=Antarcticimicrobium sediminis TaxID=2546227 RepID=A0A4R5EVL0_9RHOB|nr:DHCW motif cupin fold protein [Antarcticimicrobium sediminis]TDE38921.1 hypothetical protein E1B25_07825 [Antarcticimicrobium sediminis]
MKLPPMTFTALDWTALPPLEVPGEQSVAQERSFEQGGLRVRLVDYQPGYIADHWCDRGHVLYVLSGEMTVVLKDGRDTRLTPGMGFCVSDFGDAAHAVHSETGCRAFIVD